MQKVSLLFILIFLVTLEILLTQRTATKATKEAARKKRAHEQAMKEATTVKRMLKDQPPTTHDKIVETIKQVKSSKIQEPTEPSLLGPGFATKKQPNPSHKDIYSKVRKTAAY